jgi:hypothetical protein
MNRKRYLGFFILLLVANTIIFANKDKFVYKKQISYSTLYPVVSDIPIEEIIKLNDSVLQFKPTKIFQKPVQWHIAINGVLVDSIIAASPQVKLANGLNSYAVYASCFDDTLMASIEHLPARKNKGIYKAAFTGIYSTNFGSTSYGEIESDKNIFDHIDDKQRNEIKKILTDSVGILKSMPVSLQVEKIFVYLHKKMASSFGTPSVATIMLNSFDQYKAAVSGEKIWCGIIARIFNLFVASAGVKCRAVEIFSSYKNIRGSNHVCNEYYVPERNQWVAADIMYNNIRYMNASGKWLNLVEMKNVDHDDSTVKILAALGDSTCIQSFTSRQKAFYDLYGKEKDLLYIYKTTQVDFSGSILKRVKNYIFPEYWYQFYSDSSIVDNRNFYIKSLLICLLLFFGTMTFIGMIIKTFIKKK